MYLTGFTDEVSSDLARQVDVCRELDWHWIELRTVGEHNVVDLPESDFHRALDYLAENGISVSSFNSRIANWARTLDDPLDADLNELERAIPRMKRAGTRYLRVMSYRPPDGVPADDPGVRDAVLARLKTLSRRAEETGIVLIHENCETWGGQSVDHTLELLEAIDSRSFQLAFDTGNPAWLPDRRPGREEMIQDALEFYDAVRHRVAYVHIKDAVVERGPDGSRVTRFTWPGEGAARVPEILNALARDGYDGPLAIEPHMAVVYHDDSVTASDDERWRVFVEYARRTDTLLERAGLTVSDRPATGAVAKNTNPTAP